MKSIAIKILIPLMTILMMGVGIVSATPLPAAVVFPALSGGSILMSFVNTGGMLQAGVLKEMWTGELVNHFRHEGEWLSEVPSADQFVNNDVIHLALIGADPAVLINNTTYPIPVSAREDSDIPVSLDHFETENTAITKKELYALPYDKEGSVIRQHREALEEKTIVKAAHSICPLENTTDTPVVYTSGASNGETPARKMLQPADIAKARTKMNNLGVPKKGRVLVLCSEHVEDLISVDQKFKDQWYSLAEGKAARMYGFNIYESTANPKFSTVNNQKKAFDSADAPTTDQNTSFAFFKNRTFKARGSADMFYSAANTNPEMRRTVVGFEQYFLAMPKSSKGFVALVSATV